MDIKLVAWGMRPSRTALPRLWLFTDQERLGDPRPAVAALPVGRAGVVLRHDGDPARWALARAVAALCRRRRLTLVVAGDIRLAVAVRAGVHLRGGRWPCVSRPPNWRAAPVADSRPSGGRMRAGAWLGVVTSSAHSVADLRRAHKAGAALAFLSPAFPTQSHAGAAGLSPLRWGLLARRARRRKLSLAALGGLDGTSVHRLPPDLCQGAGAITALSP